MGGLSIWHWLVVLVVVLLLFGAGKIPKLMGDMASGIKAFQRGMREEETAQTPATTPPAEGQAAPAQPAQTASAPGQQPHNPQSTPPRS